MRGGRHGEQIEPVVVLDWELARPPLELRLEDGKLIATPAQPPAAPTTGDPP